MSIPVLAGFGAVSSRYRAALLDLWGVVHDGRRLYPGVADCLAQMRDAGYRIVFLSNAPRRAAPVGRQIERLGIAPGAYDGVMTSGEVTRDAIMHGIDPFHAALGRRFFRLGPERDWGLMEGLDRVVVDDIADADFILATGLVDDVHESVATYAALFARAIERDLAMICANPDLVVVRNGERVLCAGALAQAYEGQGGRVVYHGKPHPRIYERALAMLRGVPRTAVVAVGDSLRTDIAGARAAGLDALFVTGGIHAEELGLRVGELPSAQRLEAACMRVLSHLVW